MPLRLFTERLTLEVTLEQKVYRAESFRDDELVLTNH